MSRDLSLGMNHLLTLYENEKDFEQQQFNRNHNQNTTASGPAFDSTDGFQTGLNQSEFAFSALDEPFQTSFSSAVEDPSSANSAFRFSDLSYDNDYDQTAFPGNNLEQLYSLDTSFHNRQGNSFNPNQQYSGTTTPPIWPSMMGNENHESRNQIQYTMPLSNQAPQISIPPLKLLGNDSTSSTRSQAPISATSNNGQMEQSRNLYSKHISNVMSHFTSSKEGISKLLNEIDDFVHVVSSSGGIHFASSSVMRLLEQSQDAIIGKSLFDLLHQNDRDTAKTYIEQAISSNSEFIMYIRYISLHGSVKLCEVKGKPYFAIESESSPMTQGQMMVILSAREYSSKGMQSLDAIVELQIETLQLKRRLEEVLMQKGLDPSTHFLLSHNQSEVTVQGDSNQVDDFTESFLFTLEGQSIKGSLFEAPTIDTMDHYTMLQPSANPVQPPNSSFIGKSVVANTQGAAPAVTAAPEKKTRKRKAIHTDMFCLQCGTTKSPEWRAGPEGHKTLCNACGLAYYKKNKKLSEEKKKLAAAAVVARSNPVPTILNLVKSELI